MARRELARSRFRFGNLTDQDADRRTSEYHRQLIEYARGLAAWKLFVTVTFTGRPSERTAEAELHAWLDYVARRFFGRDVFCFYVADFQKNGRLHFHLLLDIAHTRSAPGPAECKVLESRWIGHSRVTAYEPNGRCETYMVDRHRYFDTYLACARFGECRSRCVNIGWFRD